jgi:hypothetical protein
MEFLPSAQWDDSIRGTDSVYWRSFWWKKSGAREFKLQFKYDIIPYNYELWINEIGSKNTFLNRNWWRQSYCYDMIDTKISYPFIFSAKFLPGEGKLLNVKVVRLQYDQSEDSTDCDECKLISNNELTIEYVQTSDCCWDIYFNSNTHCDSLTIPITMQFNSNNGINANFQPDNLALNPNYSADDNFWTFQFLLVHNARKKIGNVCISQGSDYISNIYVGNLVGDDPWHYYFYDTQILSCSNTFSSRCCDSLQIVPLTDSLKPEGCCFHFMVNNPLSCNYYGLIVRDRVHFNNPPSDIIIDSTFWVSKYNPNNPINFDTLVTESLCLTYFSDEYTEYFDFVFLGVDSSIQCIKSFTTDCNSKRQSLILEYLSAHPNPASESINIDYSILKDTEISLKLFTLKGDEIAIIEKGYKGKGKYSKYFDLSKFQSGLYLLRLEAEKDYKNFLIYIKR